MGLINLFKDDNDWNEKAVVGFASFIIMALFALADIITSILGMPFNISPIIYDSFTYITLGTFGINELSKAFTNRKNTEHDSKDNK